MRFGGLVDLLVLTNRNEETHINTTPLLMCGALPPEGMLARFCNY